MKSCYKAINKERTKFCNGDMEPLEEVYSITLGEIGYYKCKKCGFVGYFKMRS